MANNIKGLTVEIGGDTTKLGKALEDVNKKGRSLSSELGEINRLLKLDPGNVEILAQKQKVLADAIANTSKRLDTLKEAERQVQAQFERGEASEEQVRALQREIVATEKKLDSYEKAAKETADAVDQLGKDSDAAAEAVDDVGNEAKETEKELDGLSSTIDGAGTALGVVTGLVAAAGAALVGLAESTRDYRREIGKLETAFTTAGHSTEAAEATYKELQGVLGETDQAVEAANHLAALADSEEDLAAWTDICTGVYAKFGVSLPIEGLTEAANETSRTGTLTGGLVDALNWAAEAGETFGVKMKENTEANEDWNKRVEEATTAEEYFQLALEECSDEQERQQLITKTLTKMYKGAADQYKKTNKEVIAANKANEEWTATLAGLGAEMEPVLTDVKKLGTSLAKDLENPIKSLVGWVRDKFLPAVQTTVNWIKNNGPTVTAIIAGATAALVAYKVATIAAEVAQKGLKGAILASEAATKLLNLAQAATPWGLVATAVAAVATGLILYAKKSEEAAQSSTILTEAEQELIAAAEETAEAFNEQKAATEKALADTTAEMQHTQDLANELRGLASASGEVQEKDRERVNFILNELNSALGTEYSMVDGVIQKYDDLKASIDQVIQSKLANALLETANADYIAAIQAKDGALEAVLATEKEYQNQLGITLQKEAEYTEAVDLYHKRQEEGAYHNNHYLMEQDQMRMDRLSYDLTQEKKILDEKQAAYDEAAGQYGEYTTTINNYEDAQAAVLEGNYETTVDLLSRKGDAFVEYSDTVDEETAKVLDTLFQEAVDAGIEAERLRTNWEKGVAGYTEEMVKEAEEGYAETMAAFADAYADAEGVGTDIDDGLKSGMESGRFGLIEKAKSLVRSIIDAFRSEADSHSPSRKMIDFGLDMGEGAEIGLEDSTDDVLKAAKHQVQAMLEVYRGEDAAVGSAVQRTLTDFESRRQTMTAQAVAGNATVLDKILTAIERGQVLTIDGKALVGATASDMDGTLGQRRLLAARGAV